MDIVSHGLWSVAASKYFRQKTGKKINLWWAFWWGIFPDLFAFAVPFISWTLHPGTRPDFSIEPPATPDTMLELASRLYNYSHSLIVFGVLFLIIFYVFKTKAYSMTGWLLHILYDIPTHSYGFFPTPFLWPLADLRLNGYPWAHPWLIITNYALLGIVFLLLRKKK